ncbi:Uma2 family endonuclease [Aphanothece sacrum]|uniref:Putative restriction endonuclease domain-containing protein n=1 Tax=Aphanothece sacrum FPU1 TaxID=1920663 RepID=A0A401IJT7_APHSA|nr:Uma2 family endonuclease [Aphanothece sacrum]GBF81484.1 hypothetical protein AsFPU1_2898 [Aphanothece sacrum FPU1]GBF85615.1 hypothetical protein AsFPU3_2678 [Aphanothece sacrum FPU3]
MSNLQAKIKTDSWINATWSEYIQITENSDYQKAKFYYNKGKFRIEMSPLGNDHASDHNIITYAINLYAVVKGINLNGKDNCTYRKTGYQDAQPDLSYYIEDTVDAVPYGTSIISLDEFSPPTLVVEIANSSLADDKGEKKNLYEDLQVKEYWIIDVNKLEIIAFAIENEGSHRIRESQVLPKLEIALLEEAIRKTRQTNHSKVGLWLLEQFQK